MTCSIPSSPLQPSKRCRRKSVACRIAVAAVASVTSGWSFAALAATSSCVAKFQFGYDEPERQGINPQKLLELTQSLRGNPAPILSLALSRNGKIVYELYTSGLDRNAAHYVMSVTKSVTSALVGAAIDRHLIKSADVTVAETLPRGVFPNTEAHTRFNRVTLKNVLGMSALDAQVAPHLKTPEAIDRNNRFNRSSNHLTFALEQQTLPN